MDRSERQVPSESHDLARRHPITCRLQREASEEGKERFSETAQAAWQSYELQVAGGLAMQVHSAVAPHGCSACPVSYRAVRLQH
jgi:hypothetical protein